MRHEREESSNTQEGWGGRQQAPATIASYSRVLFIDLECRNYHQGTVNDCFYRYWGGITEESQRCMRSPKQEQRAEESHSGGTTSLSTHTCARHVANEHALMFIKTAASHRHPISHCL